MSSLPFNLAALVGLIAAFGLVAAIPARKGSPLGEGAKAFILVAIGVFLVSMASRTLDHAGVTNALGRIEEYADSLFAPLLACAAYSLFAQARVIEARRGAARLAQALRMLDTITETTPAGIVTLDASGRITWANGLARALLDLGDEVRPTGTVPYEWTARVFGTMAGAWRPDLTALVTEAPLTAAPLNVRWHDERVRRLAVSTAPMVGPDGVVTGTIAAFVEREMWLANRPDVPGARTAEDE